MERESTDVNFEALLNDEDIEHERNLQPEPKECTVSYKNISKCFTTQSNVRVDLVLHLVMRDIEKHNNGTSKTSSLGKNEREA